ncbi:MAG: glycerate kinase [Tissierellales bacterium]|jgi:glycerate kinase|nr:glycerate kinase [Tissierellales bacterium]
MKKLDKIVLAPDSFKESMTAKTVCESLEKGITKILPHVSCIHVPMADGGEGTMQSLVDATGGKIYEARVKGPLGNPVTAQYGISGSGDMGVIEMASASGLHLVPMENRNPCLTTTYGTGELIKACLNHGVKKLLIGIGGSATNDGGAGMLQALGGKLLDANGKDLSFGGLALKDLHKIDLSDVDIRLRDVDIDVACDVDNPLIGEKGASKVFGPQKGANEEQVELLEAALSHYGDIIEDQLEIDVKNFSGAGAAGGLGAGLMVFLNGKLKKGIDLVIDYVKLEENIAEADLVITGEGSLDSQTFHGKTPLGVSKLAKKYNVPVIGIAGRLGDGIEGLYDEGFTAIFSIVDGVISLDEALDKGPEKAEKLIENIMRLWKNL